MSGPNAHSRLRLLLQLLLIFILAYLPVVSFQLAIKHDFFQAYFPMKYFLSEAVREHYLPLWNPFLNYGFPIYGDMSESYWNPLTWCFALLGYTPYTFTLEQLLYMFVAGPAMYKLSGLWLQHRSTRIMMSISYMCSGFVVAHLQHFNWITASALLPLCLYMLIRYLKTANKRYFILSVFSISFFVSAVHPGMIIGLFYLLLAILPIVCLEEKIAFSVFSKRLILAGGSILFICIGIILGYTEVLPYTNRSGFVSKEAMALGSTDIVSWISFLLPGVVHTADHVFQNDMALRNCFIGLLPLAGLVTLFRSGNNISIRFAIAGLLFLVISTPLVLSFYRFIPLIQFVRLNGELRLFGLLLLQLAGTISLERCIQSDPALLKKILQVMVMICAVAVGGGLLLTFTESGGIQAADSHLGWKEWIRSRIQQAAIGELLIFQGSISILLLYGFTKALQSANFRKNLLLMVATETILITWACLPFTGVGKTPLREYQLWIDQAPKGPLVAYSASEKSIVNTYPATEKYLGGWGFYSKKAALNENLYYPLFLSHNEQFFASGKNRDYVELPFVFLKHQNNKPTVQVNQFDAYRINITLAIADTLVIKQNYFPGWKAKTAHKTLPVIRTEGTWLGVPLASGSYQLDIFFDHPFMKKGLILHLLLLSILGIWGTIYLIRYIFP